MEFDQGKHGPFVEHLWRMFGEPGAKQITQHEEFRVAASQVREVMEHPGFQIVLDLTRAAKRSAEIQMKYRGVQEQAEYTRLVGMSVGLESIEASAEAVLLEAERADKQLEAAVQAAGGEERA